MKFKEHFVQRDQHRIYAREYEGAPCELFSETATLT